MALEAGSSPEASTHPPPPSTSACSPPPSIQLPISGRANTPTEAGLLTPATLPSATPRATPASPLLLSLSTRHRLAPAVNLATSTGEGPAAPPASAPPSLSPAVDPAAPEGTSQPEEEGVGSTAYVNAASLMYDYRTKKVVLRHPVVVDIVLQGD